MERWPYPVPQTMQRHTGYRFARLAVRMPVAPVPVSEIREKDLPEPERPQEPAACKSPRDPA